MASMWCRRSRLAAQLDRIEARMATSDEVAAVQAAADRIRDGVQRIEDALTAALAGGAADPALDAALAELKAAADSLDGAVPPVTAPASSATNPVAPTEPGAGITTAAQDPANATNPNAAPPAE